jgi:hypothetical protein
MGLRKLEKKESAALQEVIDKGGEVAEDRTDQKKKWVFFSLRIRKDILNNIEEALQDRIGISKTGWILEAIQEKLQK